MPGALAAVAFMTGVAGAVVLLGRHDAGTSWYPWPSRAVATWLLTIAGSAASLSFVAWVFATMT